MQLAVTVISLADVLRLPSFAGIFGSSLVDFSPLPTPSPLADSDTGYQDNSTTPPPSIPTENTSAAQQNHSNDDVTRGRNHGAGVATSGVRSDAVSTEAPPIQHYTLSPDWLASVTSLSTPWPMSTAAVPDSGISRAGQEAAELHVFHVNYQETDACDLWSLSKLSSFERRHGSRLLRSLISKRPFYIKCYVAKVELKRNMRFSCCCVPLKSEISESSTH